MTQSRRFQASDLRDLGPAGLLGLFWLLAPAGFGFLLLAKLADASEWLESLGAAGPWCFAIIFAITSGIGILPTYAQAVVGGWVFGIAVGLPAALGGFVGGALIGWITARCVSRERVEAAVKRHPQADVVVRALKGNHFVRSMAMVTLIRIPPNSPFALTNLVLAACGVRLSASLVGTAIGMTPRTAIVIGISAAAASSGAEDIQSFVTEGPGPWMFVAGIIATLVVLGIIATVAQKAIAKMSKPNSAITIPDCEQGQDVGDIDNA